MKALTLKQIMRLARRYYLRECAHTYGHRPHLAAEALRYAEKCARRFSDHNFHGVEGSTQPDMLYLNAGDTYAETVLAVAGPWGDYRFRVGSWGDVVGDYEAELENYV